MCEQIEHLFSVIVVDEKSEITGGSPLMSARQLHTKTAAKLVSSSSLEGNLVYRSSRQGCAGQKTVLPCSSDSRHGGVHCSDITEFGTALQVRRGCWAVLSEDGVLCGGPTGDGEAGDEPDPDKRRI